MYYLSALLYEFFDQGGVLKLFWFILLTLTSSTGLVSTAVEAQALTCGGSERGLAYVLEPILERGRLHFRIDLHFKAGSERSTILRLPGRWGGQAQLYQSINHLQVLSPGANLVDTPEPDVKYITHRPRQILHVRYELVQDYTGNPKGGGGTVHYRPMLQKDFFHWIGHGVWILPEADEIKPVCVLLEWKNLPKGWTLANSFGANQQRQRFRTTLEDFTHSVFLGGDFRIKYIPVNGKPVYTAVRGDWKFSDEAFAELAQRIIKVERSFWHDFDVPFYLVTLTPLEAAPDVSTTGGTGLTNSFANFATPDAGLNSFTNLLAHEYFHNWNSQKLGLLKEPETQLYWFSEGFTDYYAYLLPVRAGLTSLEGYIRQYNSFIRDYYLSPARGANNQRVVKDFWGDGEVQKIPYRRGFLLATNWNALIRSLTGGKNSLDDVMLDMLREAQIRKPVLTPELISAHIRRYIGRDVLPDIRHYIEDGEMILPDKNAFGPYVDLEMIEVPLFELGFDLEMLRSNKVVSGVEDNSAAYRAGLRNGQVVLRSEPIHIGDAAKPVELTVKEGIGPRIIRFYPVGQKVIVPQYKLRGGISDAQRASTLRWLGVVPLADN